MPEDRTVDSYAIYSQLLTAGTIEWRDAKRSQWLIADTTTAELLNLSCGPWNTPNRTAKVPAERIADWRELMQDYDLHCHEVFRLDVGRFDVALPVQLLDEAERSRYMKLRPNNTRDEEFAGAAGVDSFSAVFFNPAHTLALVRQGMSCPGLCGEWNWVVLEKKDGRWNPLNWIAWRVVV